MPTIGETAAEIGARYGKFATAATLLNTILLLIILFLK
jgi:hypothetical protein